jgi:universal stress protein A
MKSKTTKKGGQGTVEQGSGEYANKISEEARSRSPSPLELKKILVPIDFSECSLYALNLALGFAERFQARVVLLHVVEPTMYPENHTGLSVAFDEANQSLVTTAREQLESLARKYFTSSPVEALVRIGHAHSEITDTANALGSDLIIISTHGYTGLKHVLLGSTAEKVIRYAHCPVLTVRRPERT